MRLRSVVTGVAFCLLLAAAPAAAQRNLAGEVVLEDAIAVELIGRDIVAFDLEGSGRLVERLELGEELLFTRSRGRIAIVATNRRVLGATPLSAAWQTERYRLSETPVQSLWISQSLAFVLTEVRAIAFFGTGNWTEKSIGPREEIVAARIGPATGVIVTNRRALGVSSASGGFFETKLRLNEEIESVKALAGIATITTSQRTLLFKGPSGIWVEHQRRLR